MNNAFFQFLAELATRLFSGKPKFFAIVQWISLIVGGISATVTYLKSNGTVIPGWLDTVSGVNVVIGAIVAMIIAQLPKKAE
jgi:hypothetical protein